MRNIERRWAAGRARDSDAVWGRKYWVCFLRLPVRLGLQSLLLSIPQRYVMFPPNTHQVPDNLIFPKRSKQYYNHAAESVLEKSRFKELSNMTKNLSCDASPSGWFLWRYKSRLVSLKIFFWTLPCLCKKHQIFLDSLERTPPCRLDRLPLLNKTGG